MAAVTIDSPRWREGWGETPREGWGEARQEATERPAPALRLVGSGTRRPDVTVVRRRRLTVLVALAFALAIALAVASTVLTRPGTAGSMPRGRETHVVQPGETYWSIADAYTDHGDLRIAVDRLIDANGGRALFPGDRIDLP